MFPAASSCSLRAADDVAVLQQRDEHRATKGVAERRQHEEAGVVRQRDRGRDEQPEQHLDVARDRVREVQEPDRPGDDQHEEDPGGRILGRRHKPRQQPHQPPGEDAADEQPREVVVDELQGDRLEGLGVDDAELRHQQDHEQGEEQPADEVPDVHQSPEPTQLFERRLPVEDRDHGQRRVFGEQLRAAEDDEHEADGVDARQQQLGREIAETPGRERQHHRHHQWAEPDVEPRRHPRE